MALMVVALGAAACGSGAKSGADSAASNTTAKTTTADSRPCDLLTSIVTAESKYVPGDLSGFRTQTRQIVGFASEFVTIAPPQVAGDARVFRDWMTGIETTIDTPGYRYEPNRIWDTPASSNASDDIRSWADSHCAQSIDRGAVQPEQIAVCLPTSASGGDVNVLFSRVETMKDIGDVVRTGHGVIVMLQPQISTARQRAAIKALHGVPRTTVTEHSSHC